MTSKALIQAKREASITEVAAVLGLSCRRIQQLCTAGILPKPLRKGKYDLMACLRAYSEYQRKKIRVLRGKIPRKKTARSVSFQKDGLSTKELLKTVRGEIADLKIKLNFSQLSKKR